MRTFANTYERVLKFAWESLNNLVKLFYFSFRFIQIFLISYVSHIDHDAFFVIEIYLVAEKSNDPFWLNQIFLSLIKKSWLLIFAQVFVSLVFGRIREATSRRS